MVSEMQENFSWKDLHVLKIHFPHHGFWEECCPLISMMTDHSGESPPIFNDRIF